MDTIPKYPVQLKIRRYDFCDNPEIVKKTLYVSPHYEINCLKLELQELLDLNLNKKVMKIRNPDEMLVPLYFLLEAKDSFYYIDITNINYLNKSNTRLQDAYLDAVRQKMKSLENRMAQTELILPQLEWRRQAYMEETVNAMLSKVAFLNRRFDELWPKQQAKLDEIAAISIRG